MTITAKPNAGCYQSDMSPTAMVNAQRFTFFKHYLTARSLWFHLYVYVMLILSENLRRLRHRCSFLSLTLSFSSWAIYILLLLCPYLGQLDRHFHCTDSDGLILFVYFSKPPIEQLVTLRITRDFYKTEQSCIARQTKAAAEISYNWIFTSYIYKFHAQPFCVFACSN